MSGGVAPRAVVVSRPTEYEELLGRHGTRRNVAFFLEQRGQSLEVLDERHAFQVAALEAVSVAIPAEWRRALLNRADLDRWRFDGDDVIIAVGQDGLVANVAKYLDGQPIVGVNPDPARYPGVLVRTAPADVAGVLRAIDAGSAAVEQRAMVEVSTDDGQQLRALNDLFIGSQGHQSARYDLFAPDGAHESQSSSGLVIGTGTGSTGWCASLWNDRQPAWALPATSESTLCWFVREAWPSPSTGATLTAGVMSPGETLELEARSDSLVIFGDGIEHDRLELRWGQRVSIKVSEVTLGLAV